MTHYIVRIDGPPALGPDQDESERRLLVTGDEGERRTVVIRLHGPSHSAMRTANEEDAWRAAVFYAVEQLEVAFKGEGWGVHLDEGGPSFVVEASGDSIARFVGESSARISLDDGAVVGEFGI
jgi:hypothetical protein